VGQGVGQQNSAKLTSFRDICPNFIDAKRRAHFAAGNEWWKAEGGRGEYFLSHFRYRAFQFLRRDKVNFGNDSLKGPWLGTIGGDELFREVLEHLTVEIIESVLRVEKDVYAT
jgi:hypothetical protein